MNTELHHVNVTVRREDEAVTKAFYGEIVGLPEIPKPDPGRGGAWFQLGGLQLHLSVEEKRENENSRRHICIVVDDLTQARERFAVAGVAILPDDRPIAGWSRFYVTDPGGNRIEVAQRP